VKEDAGLNNAKNGHIRLEKRRGAFWFPLAYYGWQELFVDPIQFEKLTGLAMQLDEMNQMLSYPNSSYILRSAGFLPIQIEFGSEIY